MSESESERRARARARATPERVESEPRAIVSFRRIKLKASSCFKPLADECRERDGLNGPDLVW